MVKSVDTGDLKSPDESHVSSTLASGTKYYKVCTVCGREGHLAYQCPFIPKDPNK